MYGRPTVGSRHTLLCNISAFSRPKLLGRSPHQLYSQNVGIVAKIEKYLCSCIDEVAIDLVVHGVEYLAAFAGLRGPARPSQPAGGIVLIYLGYLIDLGSLLLPLHLPLLPGDHLRDRTLMGLLLALTHRCQYFSNINSFHLT